MTNSSPQPPEPPENESRRKPILDFDEIVAIIVTFLTIGAILFWSLGSGLRRRIFPISGLKNSFSGWTNSLLSSSTTTEKPNIDSTKTQVEIVILPNQVFSGEVKSEALESTSKYLDRQSKIKDNENLDGVTAFTQPTRESFGLAAPSNILTQAAPIATDVTLGKGKIETPNVTQPKTPDVGDRLKTPETKPETPEIAFKDVPQSYWAYPFIAKLGTDKLVLGNSKSKFEPDRLITRASMATLISQSFAQPQTKKTKNFTDMPSQKEIAADINQAVETGFMHGYSDNEFRPLENIPRYQVLVTLASGLGLKSQDASNILGKFNDTDRIPNWAKGQVAAAAEAGLAVNRPGFSKNFLKPNEPATRAEVAAMIHQALVKLNKLESIDSQYIVKP